MSNLDPEPQDQIRAMISRRSVLGAGGAFALVVVGGSGLLSACGGGKTATTSAATAGGTISSGLGEQLAKLLGVTADDAKLAAGKTWKVGGCLPLTGQGSAYGLSQGAGLHLALKHIQLAGGPKIDYMEKDNKSGDATAGAAIGRELGIAGVGAQITSFVAVLGAEVPSIGQYKIMSLDPGGSVGPYTGKPYFWGSKAFPPTDTFDGLFAYLAAKKPELKRFVYVYNEEGAPTTKSYLDALNRAIGTSGQQMVASISFPYGATDMSAAVRKLQSSPDHDVVILTAYGTDTGYFMKQYAAAGLKTQVIGSDLTSDSAKIGGSAFENFWFCTDFFNGEAPPNPLSKIFATEFVAANGPLKPESYYSANYYESTLALWELMRRVLRKGGDINSGDALQKELEANPVVKSVYGGDANTVGTMTFDTTTHALKSRSMGVYSYIGGKVATLATFDIGGASLKVVA